MPIKGFVKTFRVTTAINPIISYSLLCSGFDSLDAGQYHGSRLRR